MKNVFCCLVTMFLLSSILKAQTVDSIKVEQAGDLIKVHYKILGSTPSQVFRVSVLCSIEGGLKSQLNSLAGDFGDNVVGGRDDYMVLWDVLKDIDELKSAEFFVKAELIKDLSAKPLEVFDTTKFWASKRIIIISQLDMPGSRLDLRLGYLGLFGISAHLLFGKVPVFSEYQSNPSYTELGTRFGIGLDITKCIISEKYFQLHLVGGYRNNDVIVYFSGPPSPQFWFQGAEGPELGTILAYRRVAISLMYFFYNPDQPVERNDEPVTLISPHQYFNFGIGIRF
jgi:hypothetical protein